METILAFVGGFVSGILVSALICYSATLLAKQHYNSDITEEDLSSYRNNDMIGH